MYEALYNRVLLNQPDDAVLRVNALLGLPGAAEAYAESRRGTAMSTSGFEVG